MEIVNTEIRGKRFNTAPLIQKWRKRNLITLKGQISFWNMPNGLLYAAQCAPFDSKPGIGGYHLGPRVHVGSRRRHASDYISSSWNISPVFINNVLK